MPAGRPGCGQDPSLSLSPVPVVPLAYPWLTDQSWAKSLPRGQRVLWLANLPREGFLPWAGQGRESCESPSCVGSAALVFTCFPLSFSTFPPRSSGCFPNMAAKVNGNPHSAPVRWVACLYSVPWLLRETLVLPGAGAGGTPVGRGCGLAWSEWPLSSAVVLPPF